MMKHNFVRSAIASVIGSFLVTVSFAQTAVNDPLLPPNAKAGSCYTRVFVEPVYKTETKQVIARSAFDKVTVLQPQYGSEQKRVMVKEATSHIEVVPAAYEWQEEQVLVKESTKRVVPVPAVWEDKAEKVLVRPAHTVWKRGKGPVQRVNNSTGEIMCLVEVPAEYKTVSKRVLVTPASTREEEVPAEYKTVRKRVMVTPPTTRTEVPAQYETVQVQTIVKEPTVATSHVPEELQTISRREKVAEGHMEWKPILCETNINAQIISEIQTKLKGNNFYSGPVDGIFGSATSKAINSFQKAKGLSRGGLTLETLAQLGVRTN